MPLAPSRPPRRLLAPALATLVLVALILAIAARFAPWELAVGNVVLRSQRGTSLTFPAPTAAEPAMLDRGRPAGVASALAPRNAILMIGDGMGLGQVGTASAVLHGPAGRLVMETATATGLVRTHSGDRLVTDSAAASTAMATGFKTPNGMVSMLADGRTPVSLLEAARAVGLATGVVTTCGIIDATPAGFSTHAAHRYDYPRILEGLLASGTEVLIGGDSSTNRRALRDDELQDRLGSLDSLAKAAGYELVRSSSELAAASGRVLALYPPRAPRSNAHGPPLAESVTAALRQLDGSGGGFILLVESEMTDDSGHLNDAVGVVAAVRELDATVAAVLEWAEPRGDTLVLVTADHDTGGLGVVGGEYSEGEAEVRWLSVNHTAHWVPLFAFGPGAERFSGVLENTEIGVRIADLLDIPGFPSIRP